jgi:perosamine synthetase
MSWTPIHHTYGPHVDRDYVRRVLAWSYAPWQYRSGPDGPRLQQALEVYFPGYRAALFASGRESLLALLQTLALKPGDEVLLQGYTCMVLPNAIHAAGGTPVYSDIDPNTLNLTIESVRAKLTPKTRVIICQHTFGIPGPAKELRELCDERGILLIEDLAHVLPDTKSPFYGRYGHALLLSFGRDKAISGISGGAILVQNATLAQTLQETAAQAPLPSFWEVTRTLEYATRMHSLVRPLSSTPFLKPILWLLNHLGLFASVLTADERHGHMSNIPRALPNICAKLAVYSLGTLPRINDHRRILSAFYLAQTKALGVDVPSAIDTDLPLQKFPVFTHNAPLLRHQLRAKNIHLDDGWTGCVICPDTVDMAATNYIPGSDPTAEKVSVRILSLPTHPTMTLAQAQRLVAELQAKRIQT